MPSETISSVGPITATSASARTSAGAADEHRLAGRLELARSPRSRRRADARRRAAPRGGSGRGSAARTRRRARARSSSRARRRPDRASKQVAEQRDLAEAGEHADRADRGHDQRRDRRPQADQQQQEQDPDGDQLGRGGGCRSDASLSARSIEGWPVMYGLTGAVIVPRRRGCSICGWSYLTTSFSVRSTETTIIAAVGFGRSAGAGRAGIPGRQHPRVRALGQRDHELRPLAVQLGLRALEQDRHELRRPELGVGELLGARGLRARHDGDRRRQRASTRRGRSRVSAPASDQPSDAARSSAAGSRTSLARSSLHLLRSGWARAGRDARRVTAGLLQPTAARSPDHPVDRS